jgi:putative membrane protein
MILPGISGSFILVLLGKYQYVLNAVNQRDLMTLSLVAGGACLGIAAFSRFLGWLFRRYHDPTVAILTGLMLGSLRKVWPWKESLGPASIGHEGSNTIVQVNTMPSEWSVEVAAAIALFVGGFFVVLALDRVGRRKTDTSERQNRRESSTTF